MNKFALLVVFALLFSNTAFATFELEDPAAEFAKNTPEANAKALGQISCHEFLLQGSKESGDYDKALERVYRYNRDSDPGGETPPTEAGLKDYCVEHPKNSLRDAVDAQADERL